MMSDYSGVAPPQNLSQSSAFAAALQRAKQIAAKINPGSASGSSDPPGVKRSHEEGTDDFEPDIKKLATGGAGSNSSVGSVGVSAQISAALAAATGMSGLGVNGQMTTEDIKVPDKMVGLIIGRGGEQISRLQAESGCKIQMAMDSGGAPERLCTLTGNPQAISRAKEMIAGIITQRSKTEGMGGARLDELGLSDTNGSEGRHSNMDRGSMGGHGMHSQGDFHNGSTFEMMVPGSKVGLVIGKGGETIKQLQEKSGTKMVVVQDGPNQETEKPLRISGDPQKVEHAKSLIYELLAGDRRDGGDRGGRGGGGGRMGFDRGGGGGGRGGGGGGNRWSDQSEATYVVPANKCGIIIGRGGETIKQINQTSGAHCELDRRAPPTATEKTFLIRGQPDQIEAAKRMIAEKLGNAGQDQNGGGGGPFGGGMSGGGPPGGPPQYAPQNWGGGGGGGGGPQGFQQPWGGNPQPSHDPNMFGAPQNNQVQVQVNPQTGQPDYSAQWAEYYRSVGMIREAEAIEQQAKAKQSMPQGQPAQQPAQPAAAPAVATQNGQADYSAQWAEYYRSTGKVKEAEFIEQQMKSKAAAPAPQPTPTPAAAPMYGQPQPYGYGGGAPAAPFYGANQNPAQYPAGYPGFPQAFQMQAPGQGMAPDGQ
ncbi:far upstream element-binding protein 2 [Nilaparvata lugens]|uniref:far upstream element-binding protein 2 n=1 Tax=Nilaparvata lugens TaxID=108931 RepID=UPI00193CBA37|nr:far upstream element-binding protein 2 [Nilaparvata lugens]